MSDNSPVGLHAVVHDIFLIDKGEGLAEIHVEHVQGVLPRDIRMKYGPVSSPG